VLKRNFDYGKIPLCFVPNQGQAKKKILYYAATTGYTLWLGYFSPVPFFLFQLGTFISSAMLALLIGLCTVIYHSFKAAFTNPVEAIRHE
jgi:ABC-type antimicrobial peptide transport system permease subunit